MKISNTWLLAAGAVALTAIAGTAGVVSAKGKTQGGPPPILDQFDVIDTNKDGQLSKAELKAFTPPRGPGGAGGPPPGPPPGGPMGGGMMISSLADFDTNKDGKVSETEFLAAPRKHFAQFDTNKDGVLTADEVPSPGAPPSGQHSAGQHFSGKKDKGGK